MEAFQVTRVNNNAFTPRRYADVVKQPLDGTKDSERPYGTRE